MQMLFAFPSRSFNWFLFQRKIFWDETEYNAYNKFRAIPNLNLITLDLVEYLIL